MPFIRRFCIITTEYAEQNKIIYDAHCYVAGSNIA